MPLREYLCKKCGHRFEKIQKFSDKLIKKCPDCGGPVEETISAPAVRFKGSGFYITDYAKKSNASASSSSRDESSGKSGGEGSGKSNSEGSSKSSNGGSGSEGSSKETKKEDKPKSESSDKKSRKN
jgi:putative FmdB family regulatory protein